MSSEAAPPTKPPLWATNVTAFFHLPNPRITILFIISSTATISLGTAMIVEWFLYSQYHPGYHWIAYYAPSLIALSVSAWILCFISATFFWKKDQNGRTLPVSAEDKARPQEIQALQDHFAVVPVEHAPDHLSVSIEKPADMDQSTLKRVFSLRLPNVSLHPGNLKRTLSSES